MGPFSETLHSTSEEQIVRVCVCVYESARVHVTPPMSNNHPDAYHPFSPQIENRVKGEEKSSTVEVLYEMLL